MKNRHYDVIRSLVKELLLKEGGWGDVALQAGYREKYGKPEPVDYNDRFYEKIYDLCSPRFPIDTITDAYVGNVKVQIISQFDGETTLENYYLVSTRSSDDSFNKIFNNFGGIKISDDDLAPSGRINKLFTKLYPNENVRDRKIRIAKIKSSADVQKTSIINPDLEFFAIIKCSNSNLFALRRIETLSNVTGFLTYMISHPLKTYRDVGKRIAELPDKQEKSIVSWLNIAGSALGIADLFVGGGSLGAAAIGPMLVLASYYKYAMPDDKTFGIPTSAFYTVCAALGAVGSIGRAAAATATGKEISDLAMLTKQFASVRSSAGLSELGLIASDDVAKISTITKNGYNASSLETLMNFCKKFPELQRQWNFSTLTRGVTSTAVEEMKNVGYWSKVSGSLWTWTSASGKQLTNPNTGKVILFSDDVRSMIIFAAKHQSTIARFVEWHNMMPGYFSKLLMTVGFAADSYLIANTLSTLEENVGEIPVELNADLSNFETKTSSEIKNDYYSKILRRDSVNLKTLITNPSSGTTLIYNFTTKESKATSSLSAIIPLIQNAVKKHSSNSDININDINNIKLLIVDDSIYDNFNLLIKAPINLERRINSGQVVAFKHAPGVYSLVQKSEVIELMNSKD